MTRMARRWQSRSFPSFRAIQARGLAYIQAAVLVLEPDTGRLVGLLEGSSLTAIRTGAASGAAVDLLSRPESHVLAVFGAGAQGRTQIEAACTVREIHTVWIYDPGRERPQAGRRVGRAGANPCAICASPAPPGRPSRRPTSSARRPRPRLRCSRTPIVKAGAHISAVGSYTPEMQEIPAETVQRARVIVDSRSAALAETGDLIQPIRAGRIGPDHIAAELGEMVLGRVPGRQSADQITFFKSVGIAVQDAMAGSLAIRNAISLGIGQEVQLLETRGSAAL